MDRYLLVYQHLTNPLKGIDDALVVSIIPPKHAHKFMKVSVEESIQIKLFQDNVKLLQVHEIAEEIERSLQKRPYRTVLFNLFPQTKGLPGIIAYPIIKGRPDSYCHTLSGQIIRTWPCWNTVIQEMADLHNLWACTVCAWQPPRNDPNEYPAWSLEVTWWDKKPKKIRLYDLESSPVTYLTYP